MKHHLPATPADASVSSHNRVPADTVDWHAFWRLLPWVVLVVSLASTLTLLQMALDKKTAEIRLRFGRETENAFLALSDRLKMEENVAADSAAAVRSGLGITRDSWASYVDGLDLDGRRQGSEGISTAPLVRNQDLVKFLKQRRADSAPDFQITPPGARTVYLPLVFTEPRNPRTIGALGFDLFSEHLRRTAIERARDSGKPTVTGKIVLVQDAHENRAQSAVDLIAPVFAPGVSLDTVQQRRAAFTGVICDAFRSQDFLAPMFRSWGESLDIRVFAAPVQDDAALLYASHKGKRASPPRFTQVRQLPPELGSWTIAFSSTPKFEAGVGPSGLYWLGLAAGLFASFASTAGTYQLVHSRRRALAAAAAMTAQLRDREERFRMFLGAVEDYAIVTLDPDWKIATWNSGAEILLGYRANEVLGTQCTYQASLGTAEEQTEIIGAPGLTGCIHREAWRVRKDGSRFRAHISRTTVSEGGKIVGFTILMRDVTADHQAQLALRNSQERLRDAQDLAKVGYWDLPGLDGVATASSQAAEMMGLDPVDPSYTLTQYIQWVVPDDRARVLGEIARSQASGEPYDSVHRFRRPDGEVRWFHRRAHFERTDSGSLVNVRGIVVDITAEKEAELTLTKSRDGLEAKVIERTAQLQDALNEVRDAEGRLRKLADALPVIVWSSNPRGEFTYQNQRWYDYLQPDREEAPEATWAKACHPEDAPASVEAWCAAAAERRQLEIQIRIRRSDGAWRWHLGRLFPMLDESGEISEWFGAFTDLHDQKSEQLVRQRRVKQIVDTISEIIIEVTIEGHWSFLNPAWTAHTGFSVEESLGRSAQEWLHPDDRAGSLKRLGHVASGEHDTQRSELRFRTRSSGYRWMEAVTLPAYDEKGNITGLVGALTDIHDRKEAEEGLREARAASDRANRAKSEFLATISRELRTPLGGLVGKSRTLLEGKLTNKERATASSIGESAQDLLRVLNRLLDLSRLEAGLMKLVVGPADLRLATEDVIESFAAKADRKGLDLALWYQAKLPKRVMFDVGRYRQLLSILVENAIDFTPKGNVVLSVEEHSKSASEVALRIEVKDTGLGIAREKLPVLFERFAGQRGLRDREPGKPGLGLALARELASAMNAHLSVESEIGQGTTVTFHVNVTRDPDEWPSQAAPEVFKGSRILIADPSLAVQKGFRSTLEPCGLELHEAFDGPAALTLVKSEAAMGRPFSAVLYSTELPGLDWDDFGAVVRETAEFGNPPLILLTRSNSFPSEPELTRAGYAHVLCRNASRFQLWTTLEQVLDKGNAQFTPFKSQVSTEPSTLFLSNPAVSNLLIVATPGAETARITDLVDGLGYNYSIAGDLSTAALRVRQSVFDLILLDQAVSPAAVVDSVRSIYTERGNGSARIALLVDQIDESIIQAAEQSGIDEVFAKPLTADALTAALARFDYRSKLQRPVFDRAALLVRFGNDEDLLSETAQEFGENTVALMAALVKGIGAQNTGLVLDCLEKLKSAGLFVSARPLCDQLDRITELVLLEDWAAVPGCLFSTRMEFGRLTSELASLTHSNSVLEPVQ